MEADEVQELEEQSEKARENSLRPVSFTMSVLAVLVAVFAAIGVARLPLAAVLLVAIPLSVAITLAMRRRVVA